MNEMLDSKIDNKNVGLLKNLFWLRQELDVYCLLAANKDSIGSMNAGKSFFDFLRGQCVDLIALNICKVYEYEKAYELDSVEGVLKHIIDKCPSVLHKSQIDNFIHKYHGQDKGEPLSALASTVTAFRKKYQDELERFETYRDKKVAHNESGFDPNGLPSYSVMECLFNFALDFYMLVSRAFISVGPCDLNSDRRVKMSLKRVLKKLGFDKIKTDME